MRDENYIKGMRCPNPECLNEECFEIELDPVTAYASKDKIELTDEPGSWNKQSWCRCSECRHTGTVEDFTIPQGGAK